ncbi:hypothetical protein TSUD_238760 [Trifolium subterraneum]|uniref:Uncharacterized protein n=1 Tax=Trifolium subterraneum TaxID=3900 RepID=A0A2Z6PMH9_TRISU|nr:hypothetical protein TSUD_238760 [Trifolium subterraneum]
MAEAILEVVLDNLTSLIRKELGLFLGFDQDLKRLASLLTTIKATLEDAEEKQFTDNAIKDWLLKLKDAAYVLDDILDECATKALEMEYQGFNCGLSHKVHSSCLSFIHPKHVAFRYKLAKKMKRIGERLDEISVERSKFHLIEIVRERRGGVLDWRQTTSIINQPLVHGRDEDKYKIVDFLVDSAAEFEDLPVYPIVGLGGLGKTTLAQLVFNHESIVKHFELRIWVCVSEDFSLKRLTKSIIESTTKKACNKDLDLDPLQRKLQDLLGRKRYLLILDDVWNDKQEKWYELKSLLACGGKGSSILVTTRLAKVAEIMGTLPPHELSRLSNKDCWELFKQRAFGPNEVEQAGLVVIGKDIVNKCGGVPLAAIALGNLLRFEREEKEWLYVKKSKLWSLQGEDTVMPALRLSYLNLSVKLRQCFSFCALFPKDEFISKQILIEFWIANGFISSNQMLEAEDVGNEVWNELYRRSFFQHTETDEFGQITFKMHDLVYDLAQSVANETCCITDDDAVPNMSERIRHLSIYKENPSKEVNSIQLLDVQSLKTYMEWNFNIYDDGQLSPQVLKCYSLRVLLRNRLDILPTSIGRLKYLRYLDLLFGRFDTLPESLGKLCNLQVLKLDYCSSLQQLPDSLIHLKALQHLSLIGCESLSSLPAHIGKLISLKNLSIYIVGKEKGFHLKELGQLKLKGDLQIKHLERVKSVTDAKEANISRKNLNRLWLSWDTNEASQLQENVEQILEVLQPHAQQLHSFGVEGYTGARFPQWISSPSLKDLSSLQLVDCKSCLNLPKLWNLPSLKYLKICNMIHVIYLFDESYNGEGLMALKSLTLEKMPNLIGLLREERENMFPRLKTLKLFECPHLLSLPSLPSLNDLYIEGNYNQELPSSIHKLCNLESLHFSHNEELIYFPDWNLRNLASSIKTLGFHQHSELKILPSEMIHFHALEVLYINYCRNINSLTDEVLQGLHSLKVLDIVGCHKFNMSSGFQYLTCLETLAIGNCSKVEGLHEALQHMTTLQSLTLSDLPNIESLPECFENLTSLRELRIYVCPKLACLPTTIQHLSGMKTLSICGCPELEKRCRKEIGEDWPKIAHIEYIDIQNFDVYHGALGDSYFHEDADFLWLSL